MRACRREREAGGERGGEGPEGREAGEFHSGKAITMVRKKKRQQQEQISSVKCKKLPVYAKQHNPQKETFGGPHVVVVVVVEKTQGRTM